MFKFIIITLIVVGSVTSVPPIRQRVLPPLARALGPTGERMMTPFKKWEAKTDCEDLMRELRATNTAGRAIPEPKGFTAWAQFVMREPTAGIDPWGSRYYYKLIRNQMTVGSPGPDLKRETIDDITVTAPWGVF
jgi:hypothetical protein